MQALNLTAPQCNQHIRIVGNVGLRLVHVTCGDKQPFILRYSEVAIPSIDHVGAHQVPGWRWQQLRPSSLFPSVSPGSSCVPPIAWVVIMPNGAVAKPLAVGQSFPVVVRASQADLLSEKINRFVTSIVSQSFLKGQRRIRPLHPLKPRVISELYPQTRY